MCVDGKQFNASSSVIVELNEVKSKYDVENHLIKPLQVKKLYFVKRIYIESNIVCASLKIAKKSLTQTLNLAST